MVPRGQQLRQALAVIGLISFLVVLQHLFFGRFHENNPQKQTYKRSFTHGEPIIDTRLQPANGNTGPLFVTVEHVGRLGNLMFQLASSFGVAQSVGKKLHVLSSNELLTLFPAVQERAFITKNANEVLHSKKFIDRKNCAFVQDSIQFALQAANVTMSGYFQSWRYFGGYQDDVLKLFSFRSDILGEADLLLTSIRDSYLNSSALMKNKPKKFAYIALHVRRGDIATPHYVNYGYELASGDYVRKATTYFSRKYRSQDTALLLLVFSEPTDMIWARKELASATGLVDHIEYVANNTAHIDMAMISRCNATIMTVGTFGWWAAYLAGGDTIYYARPFRAGTTLAGHFELTDYYPPTWISMT